jgi:hypothetical protein
LGDIEKMYPKISLCKKQRKYHRITWRQSPELRLKMYQMTSPWFGTPLAPFLLTLVINHFEKHYEKGLEVQDIFKNNLYMDDCILGFEYLNEGAIKVMDIHNN